MQAVHTVTRRPLSANRADPLQCCDVRQLLTVGLTHLYIYTAYVAPTVYSIIEVH
jgi:hypothetical protein